jgi:hypothetical protein
MKNNNNNINTILFFLFIILLIAQIYFFLNKKTYRRTEGFLAPGTQEGGAQWDGKAWNFINKNHSTRPLPIDLNTEGAILGEMNNLQLLPSEIKNNLHGDSYKAGLLQVERVTRPPSSARPNPFMFPQNPFQNPFQNIFLNQNSSQHANPFMNLSKSMNPFMNLSQPNNKFQQQQKTWNSIFQR